MVTAPRETERSDPLRTCIGCRSNRAQSEMVRCAFTPTGPRVGRREPGRGAWLCSLECFDRAAQRKAFRRAWRSDVPAEQLSALRRAFDEVVTEVRE